MVFLDDVFSNGGLGRLVILCAWVALIVSVGIWYNLRAAKRMTEEILRANVEDPARPLTVSFSPDLPGPRDSQRTDYWVRVNKVKTEVLFYHPNFGRWRDVSLAYGLGYAFIDGQLCTFRAIPTVAGEDLIDLLNRVTSEQRVDESDLASLDAIDPDELYTVVEAIGLVRPLYAVLQRVARDVGLRTAPRLFKTFGLGSI